MGYNALSEAWEYEPPDYEVGLSGGWTHTACSEEYDQGVEELSDRIGPEIKGYAEFKYTLVCLDCTAQFTFTQSEFVGFDEREIPNYDEDF